MLQLAKQQKKEEDARLEQEERAAKENMQKSFESELEKHAVRVNPLGRDRSVTTSQRRLSEHSNILLLRQNLFVATARLLLRCCVFCIDICSTACLLSDMQMAFVSLYVQRLDTAFSTGKGQYPFLRRGRFSC